jgi:predicted nuclease of predicted toxin-antitoxin system
MRILFDQATPVPIRLYLAGHDVRTAAQQGWDTLKNGELLAAAEAEGFGVLLTTDKNMRYQQNLAGRKIAVVVLGLQQWPSLRPHVQRVVEAIKAATPGSYTKIDFPSEPERDRGKERERGS